MANVLPVPIVPSRSDTQTSDAVTSPSSASDAVPVNVCESPWSIVMVLAGAVIVTTGAAFATIVMSITSESDAPSESITDAVIV